MKKASTSPLIQLQNINLQICERDILQNINLEVSPHDIVTIIGPNGAGKTTLIRLILGLIKPTSGKINKHTKLRTGYMPQHMHIENTLPLSVLRFLQLAPYQDKNWMQYIIERIGIQPLLSNPVYHLSGGELQRILLTRALLTKPSLLVLDEPVQGIDVNSQAKLYSLLAEIRDELNCAILMVSHDLHFVMSTTDHVICLNHHVCCSGHPENITRHPEFQALFGIEQASSLALYLHDAHHDHTHHVNTSKLSN